MLLNKCLPAGLTDHLMCLLRADRAAAVGDAGERARLVGGDTSRKLLALETRAGEGIAVKVCKIQIHMKL